MREKGANLEEKTGEFQLAFGQGSDIYEIPMGTEIPTMQEDMLLPLRVELV